MKKKLININRLLFPSRKGDRSMKRKSMQSTIKMTAAGAATLILGAALPAFAAIGPSSSQTPYLNGVAAGVEFTSILTVGDEVKKKHKGNETYRMVGITDGLGAYDNHDGTITVLMNHELRNTLGVPRAHGGIGAFVSNWQIRKSDLKVLKGEDLIQKVMLWDPATESYVDGSGTAFNRFCAAELAPRGAFFNKETGKGFSEGRIFMNGEENDGGRAFAHVAAGRQQGTSYELPKMGKAAWENAVASPFAQDKTIVAGLDDGNLNASKVYFYVGEKMEDGSPVDMAGLTNGMSYEMAMTVTPSSRMRSTRFRTVLPAASRWWPPAAPV